MTTPINERLAAVAGTGRRCEVANCFLPARRFGSKCNGHASQHSRTGHAQGHIIPRHLWRGWRDDVKAFVQDREAHPGIQAALAWLGTLLAEVRLPPPLHRRSHVRDRYARWLCLMVQRGVQPIDLLASVAAIHAVREDDPRAFRDDRHFRHQVAAAFLSVVPRPKRSKVTARGYQSSIDATARLRDHVGHQLAGTIGVLAARLGKEVVARNAPPRPLPDQHAPFDSTTTLTTNPNQGTTQHD